MNYFLEKELACPCCGKNNIQKSFLDRLNRARKIAGIPFCLNSACRCAEHNQLVGGSVASSHVDGIAADIRVVNSTTRFVILTALLRAGFLRIGVGKTFIHADSDRNKTPGVCWVY